MINKIEWWLIRLRTRWPGPGEAGRPAFDQPLNAKDGWRCSSRRHAGLL